MLDWLKSILQNVLIWLLLFINGGKLPPELLPPINIPDIDWSSLVGQNGPWQLQMPASTDGAGTLVAARKAQASRPAVLPDANQVAQEADLLPASLGSLDGLAAGRAALTGALAGGMGNALAALDPSTPIVNPSGVPREMLGALYPWRSKGSRRASVGVATEIVEAEPAGRLGIPPGLLLLGAGALAVGGYAVTRRRR